MRDRNFASQGGRRTARVCVLAVAGLLVCAAPALADLGATFDSNAGTWQVQQGDTVSPTAPSWISTDGNPGGFIRFTETDPVGDDQGGFFINDSSTYAGDRSSYYGDNLRFDLRINGVAQNRAIIVLFGDSDAGRLAAFAAPQALPTTSWTSYVIPLFESDWKAPVGNLTKANFKTLLGHLTSIEILADYQTVGGETTDLDNMLLNQFTGPEVARHLTLSYSQHAFRGTLSSDDPGICPVGPRVVGVFKRTKGDDKLLGLVLTDSNGEYVLQQPAKKGHFYAFTRETHTTTEHCLEAKSPAITRG